MCPASRPAVGHTRVASQEYVAGAIVHAAFFTNALALSQARSLWPAAPNLSVGYNGTEAVISYRHTLVSSTNVAGPNAPVADAAGSPCIVPQTAPQRFYRACD